MQLIEDSGKTPMLFTKGGRLLGIIAAADAVKALVTLGFKQNDAETAIRELVAADPERKLSTSALITKALSRMTNKQEG